MEDIQLGRQYGHYTGRIYTPIMIANGDTENPDKHPQTVIYIGPNGKIWSRPVSEWDERFTLLKPKELI